MENADEIYSLCQLVAPPPEAVAATTVEPATAVIREKPSSSPKQQQQQQKPAATTAVKKSSTEKVFRPKCLVDSSTFLLPAGDGPVLLDVKDIVQAPKTTTITSTANVFKKKPQIVCSESPKAATAKIFAPRTEDMNKGFLTFSDDDTGLTSKFVENT